MHMMPPANDNVLNNIHTAVLVFNRELGLLDINTAGENLLSLSQRQACGHNAYALLPHATVLVDNIQRAITTGQPYMEWSLELSLAANRLLTVDCMVTPVLEDQQCNQVILEIIDADSHSRVMREARLTAVHEAARKSVSGMAHEIKNPLGALRGAAQLLQSELTDAALREYTRIIISEADRLQSLVDRMLAPSVKRRIAPVNIHEVLEYVCHLISTEGEPGLKIVRDYDPSLPLLDADRGHLIQVIMNIMQNARQAVDRRGRILIKTRIRRCCTIRQKTWKLVVVIELVDDGPGVPEEISEQIFYPMVTGRAEGTGLGLSIAQSLVHSHGGAIEYERLDGQSCFRVSLPVGCVHEN